MNTIYNLYNKYQGSTCLTHWDFKTQTTVTCIFKWITIQKNSMHFWISWIQFKVSISQGRSTYYRYRFWEVVTKLVTPALSELLEMLEVKIILSCMMFEEQGMSENSNKKKLFWQKKFLKSSGFSFFFMSHQAFFSATSF